MVFQSVLIFFLFWSASADPLRPAGDLTSGDHSRHAFSHPSPGAEADVRNQFFVGNSFFRQSWVAAPASTAGRDGLGPTYNAVACASCHVLDGRGPAYLSGKVGVSLLFRLKSFENGAWGENLQYGGQLNPFGISGVPGEVKVTHHFEEMRESYPDGTIKTLRRPVFDFQKLVFGALTTKTVLSPRIAPQMVGLGLIEAISETDILALADPDDRDGNGISGRPHWVEDRVNSSQNLGRFGWKAEQPSVRQQVAGAFLGDIGITSVLFPAENCPSVQVDCLTALNGGSPELEDVILDRVTIYSQHLAVPSSRFQSEMEYYEGLKVFRKVGCADCHTESYTTASGHGLFSGQKIYPFSDFLLHDMGEGLSDFVFDETTRKNIAASVLVPLAREWRTPPLWGLGLIRTVNKHLQLMHDGRADGVEEAILWHGGEGQRAKEAFKSLPASDRAKLIDFVENL